MKNKELDQVFDLNMEPLLQGTPEWHEERLKKLTSSRFSEMLKKEGNHEAKGSQLLELNARINAVKSGEIDQEIHSLKILISQKQKEKRGTKTLESNLEKLIAYNLPELVEQLKIIESEFEKSKYGTAALNYVYEKIAEHITGASHYTTSHAMEWGTDHEDEARQLYEKTKDVKVVQCGFIAYEEIAGGSPDGLVGEDGIVEIKCPYNPANHVKIIITNAVPENHVFQCQGNLMATNRKWADYMSYDPRVNDDALRLHIIRLNRNEEIIKAIQKRLKEVNTYISDLLISLI